MRYREAEFSADLKERIIHYEVAIRKIAERLPLDYNSVLADKGIKLDASFGKDGQDPFIPGYISSISIGVEDENGEFADLHTINICLLYTSPSPRDGLLSRMPSSA